MRWIKTMTIGATVAGLAVASVAIAGSDSVCPTATLAGKLDGVAAATAGARVAALHDGRVTVVDPDGDRRAYDVGARGMLRHLSATPGTGVALVDDVRGTDTLVVATASGVERLPAGGEASHPDLSVEGSLVWVEDLQRLRYRAAAEAEIAELPAPAGAAAVFAPTFAPDGSIVVAVEEAVETVPVEGETQSNLYRFDPATKEWARLTAFEGSAARWTVIRTPVVLDTGAVLFVRLAGDPRATRSPFHELWRLDATGVEKVRDLPVRRFLAGVDGESLLWNDEVGDEWRLRSERSGGTRDLGCGRVMVDPSTELDPDLVAEGEGPSPDMDELAGGPSTARMAVVVGDFSSRVEAASVAKQLGGSGLQVIDHDGAPGAVAPGAFAVAMPLPAGADLEAALEAFRGRFPAFVERSWVAALG